MGIQSDLVVLVHDPAKVRSCYQRVKSYHAAFPKSGCAYTLHQFLKRIGIVAPRLGLAEDLAAHLISQGWKRVLVTQKPEPGFVYVCIDSAQDPDHNSEHIGVVAGNDGWPTHFVSADNNMNRTGYSRGHRPYRRNVGFGPRTTVDYWLRPPE